MAGEEVQEEYLFLHQAILQTIRASDNNVSYVTQMDGITLRLDYIKRYVVNIGDQDQRCEAIVSQLDDVIESLEEEKRQKEIDNHPMAAKLVRQERGRPKFDIREETLSRLLEIGFKVPVIADLLMVSTRTVERRMHTFGLTVSG